MGPLMIADRRLAEASLGAATTASLSSTDYCDGGADWLVKKHQSAAIVGGISYFYGLALWNDEGDSDCAGRSLTNVDLNLDGTDDIIAGNDIPCAFGEDPDGGSAYPTDGQDWLDDLAVNTDAAPDCVGPVTDRSSEYDWWRYFWNMHSLGADTTPGGGVLTSEIFDIYVGADPANWDADGGGSTSDDPYYVWTAAASVNFATEHGTHENGIDH